jgi:hypothetical protein
VVFIRDSVNADTGEGTGEATGEAIGEAIAIAIATGAAIAIDTGTGEAIAIGALKCNTNNTTLISDNNRIIEKIIQVKIMYGNI